MSISDSTLKGKLNEVVGHIKQGIGEAVGNEKLANEGAAERLKGDAQQAWGSVKEGIHDASNERTASAETDAHTARETLADKAHNAKEHISEGIDALRR